MTNIMYKHKSGLVFNILSACTAEVVGFQSDKKNVFIPKLFIYEGHEITVIYIGEKAFYDSKISSVRFERGSNVVKIKHGAFTSSEINEITIPSSVQKISLNAFSRCQFLSKVEFEQDSELRKIGPKAFNFCSSLENFEFPKNVAKIGSDAFSNCGNLNCLIFPKDSKIMNIESDVFSSTNLKKLTITSSLVDIYTNFGECSNLLELIIYGNDIELKRDYFIGMEKIRKVSLPIVRFFRIDENCGNFQICYPRNVVSSGKGLQEHDICYIGKEIGQSTFIISRSTKSKQLRSLSLEQAEDPSSMYRTQGIQSASFAYESHATQVYFCKPDLKTKSIQIPLPELTLRRQSVVLFSKKPSYNDVCVSCSLYDDLAYETMVSFYQPKLKTKLIQTSSCKRRFTFERHPTKAISLKPTLDEHETQTYLYDNPAYETMVSFYQAKLKTKIIQTSSCKRRFTFERHPTKAISLKPTLDEHEKQASLYNPAHEIQFSLCKPRYKAKLAQNAPCTTTVRSIQTDCDFKSIDDLERKIHDLECQLRKKEEEKELLKKDLNSIKEQYKSLANEKAQALFDEIKSFKIITSNELDQLEKGKQIGKGATSLVLKVYKKNEYALKCLNADILKRNINNQNQEEEDNNKEEQSLDVDKVRPFLNEYEILNQMNNVNIVKTYGFFMGDKTRLPSILLEYCPINLKKFIELGHYCPNDIAFITIQICHAMKYIHEKGIIHRDIKPENILLSADNVVKLSDFGISIFVSIEEQITYSNIVGTFNYMAPELLNNVGKYNFKVDVYAFGIVLYFMLTGKLPEISFGDFLCGNKAQTPSSLNSFSKHLIERCCAHDPSKRPNFQNIIMEIKQNHYRLIDSIDGILVKNKLKRLYRRE